MKKILTVLLLLLVGTLLFADSPFTSQLAKELDSRLHSSREVNKYDGYVIWVAPVKDHKGNFFEGAKQYSSVEAFQKNHKKGNLLVYVVGVNKEKFSYRFSSRVLYLGKTNYEDDIAYYKKPKVYFRNKKGLSDTKVTCKPTLLKK